MNGENDIYFRYETSKYSGYKINKIRLDGFKILLSNANGIVFKIDKQLIRKLKILNINNKIRKNSVEDYIFELLEKSKKYSDVFDINQISFPSKPFTVPGWWVFR